MAHQITNNLEQLPEKLSESDQVDFYIASSHGDVPGGAVHGFAVLVVANGAHELKPIMGWSDSTKSSAPRGALAGTLTSLEWALKNCKPGARKRISAATDYVYEHLPKQIDKWVAETGRANRGLIIKILGEYDKVGRESVQFSHLPTHDAYYVRALGLAIKVKEERMSDWTVSGLVSSFPPIADSDDESPELTLIDDDWLRKRAMSKEP